MALYIRTDGNDGNSGTGSSAGEALATLWKALDICNDSDTIYLAPGTYTETSKDCLYVDNANLTIIGDVTGSQFSDIGAGQIITNRGTKTSYLNFRTANTLANPTIVSGIWPKSLTPTGFTAFVFENGSNHVILQDIDITDLAIATSMVRYFVRTEAGSSDITARRCHILRMNAGIKEGASIKLDGGATVRIENLLLVQPSGIATGAIYVTSGFSGGVEIYNCGLFSPAGAVGRCLYVASPNVTLKNNILIADMDDPAQSVVLEVAAGVTGTFTSDYNDLLQRGLGSFGRWGGSTSTNLAGWQSDSSQDAASISSESLFSVESQPEDEGLSIGIDSPCRDAGTGDSGDAPTEDILQFSRPSGSDHDIGAYEYPSGIAVVISKTGRR